MFPHPVRAERAAILACASTLASWFKSIASPASTARGEMPYHGADVPGIRARQSARRITRAETAECPGGVVEAGLGARVAR